MFTVVRPILEGVLDHRREPIFSKRWLRGNMNQNFYFPATRALWVVSGATRRYFGKPKTSASIPQGENSPNSTNRVQSTSAPRAEYSKCVQRVAENRDAIRKTCTAGQ